MLILRVLRVERKSACVCGVCAKLPICLMCAKAVPLDCPDTVAVCADAGACAGSTCLDGPRLLVAADEPVS